MKLLDSRVSQEVDEFTVRFCFLKFRVYYTRHQRRYYYSKGTRLSLRMVNRLIKAKWKSDALGIIKRNSLNYERS